MLTNTRVNKEESTASNKISDTVLLDHHRILMILIKKYRFKLTIPLADEQPKIDFGIAKKSFAIACYTLAPKEYMMKYIQNEFGSLLQYICISSPKLDPSLVFIQIILRTKIYQQTYFFQKLAGMQCNYQVTVKVKAWNQFLKQVGNYIEFEAFQLEEVRLVQQKPRQRQLRPLKDEKINEAKSIRARKVKSRKNQQLAERLSKDILLDMQAFVASAIASAMNKRRY